MSLEVYHGEVLGIVGESGSGKTTLMRSLYMDLEPTGGRAFLRDYGNGEQNIWDASAAEKRDIRSHSWAWSIRTRYWACAWTSPPRPTSPKSSSRRGSETRSDDRPGISAAGSGGAPTLPHGRGSQALFRRHAAAGADLQGAGQQPTLLLLDEVTTGLDLSVQARVLDLIRRIKAKYGISILLVSQDLAVIRMLADRTVVMLDGRVVESGLTDQILEDPSMPLPSSWYIH